MNHNVNMILGFLIMVMGLVWFLVRKNPTQKQHVFTLILALFFIGAGLYVVGSYFNLFDFSSPSISMSADMNNEQIGN